jgi:hypothetical protein
MRSSFPCATSTWRAACLRTRMTQWAPMRVPAWCSLEEGESQRGRTSGSEMVAFGLYRTIHASTVSLCETVTSSTLTLETCKEYIHAVLDQRAALAGVKFLDEANADEVWDVSVSTSCKMHVYFRGIRGIIRGMLQLEETTLASTAIDQYCANVTDSCADFAACKNGVFDNLLVDPELAEISTKLTARELLSLEAPRHSEYLHELWGARRLVSVMYFPSGPFRVKIVPGLSLTSFSKQVCHGRSSSCVLSLPLLRCAVWALHPCIGPQDSETNASQTPRCSYASKKHAAPSYRRWVCS